MNVSGLRILVSLAILVFTAACLRAEPPSEAMVLFDGQTFTGWNGDIDRTWRIEDGAIVAGDPAQAAPRNEFLATDREFEDFELRYEYRIEGTVKPNAGVQFRSRRIPDHHEVIGYQADIGPGITGALYDESRRKTFLVTPPDAVQAEALARGRDGWHTGVVRCEGPRVRISVNGVATVDYTEAQGYRILIALFSSENSFEDIVAPSCFESLASNGAFFH